MGWGGVGWGGVWWGGVGIIYKIYTYTYTHACYVIMQKALRLEDDSPDSPNRPMETTSNWERTRPTSNRWVAPWKNGTGGPHRANSFDQVLQHSRIEDSNAQVRRLRTSHSQHFFIMYYVLFILAD